MTTISSSSNSHNFFHTDGIKKTKLNLKFIEKCYWKYGIHMRSCYASDLFLCFSINISLDYIKTGQKATQTPLPKEPYYFMLS